MSLLPSSIGASFPQLAQQLPTGLGLPATFEASSVPQSQSLFSLNSIVYTRIQPLQPTAAVFPEKPQFQPAVTLPPIALANGSFQSPNQLENLKALIACNALMRDLRNRMVQNLHSLTCAAYQPPLTNPMIPRLLCPPPQDQRLNLLVPIVRNKMVQDLSTLSTNLYNCTRELQQASLPLACSMPLSNPPSSSSSKLNAETVAPVLPRLAVAKSASLLSGGTAPSLRARELETEANTRRNRVLSELSVTPTVDGDLSVESKVLSLSIIGRYSESQKCPYSQAFAAGQEQLYLETAFDGKIYGKLGSGLFFLSEPSDAVLNRIGNPIPKKSFDAVVKRHNSYMALAYGDISITYLESGELLTPFVQLVQLMNHLRENNWIGKITINLIDPIYKLGIQSYLDDPEQISHLPSIQCFFNEVIKNVPCGIDVDLLLFADQREYLGKGLRYDTLVIVDLPSAANQYCGVLSHSKSQESVIVELTRVSTFSGSSAVIRMHSKEKRLERIFPPKNPNESNC